jgi:hypothetical protein
VSWDDRRRYVGVLRPWRRAAVSDLNHPESLTPKPAKAGFFVALMAWRKTVISFRFFANLENTEN